MKIILVEEGPGSRTLIEKLCEAKDGSILELTEHEMDSYANCQFLYDEASQPACLMEVDKEKSYIMLVKESKVNIEDLVTIIHRMEYNISIVRYK